MDNKKYNERLQSFIRKIEKENESNQENYYQNSALFNHFAHSFATGIVDEYWVINEMMKIIIKQNELINNLILGSQKFDNKKI